jgi:hypothetical protein
MCLAFDISEVTALNNHFRYNANDRYREVGIATGIRDCGLV